MNLFQPEWEWGWKTPLLLHLGDEAPPEATAFLSTSLEQLDLARAEIYLQNSLSLLKTFRIGVRFERIKAALFLTHPDTEVLRTSIVIPGITEIDLLHQIRTLPGAWIHWEVAIKFYLGLDAEGSTDLDRWVGPTLRDTLGIKTRTIENRQLAVLKNPAIRKQIGLPETDRVIALPQMQGILFVPWNENRSIPTQPSAQEKFRSPQLTPDGTRGYWVTRSQLPLFLKSFESSHPEAQTLFFEDKKDWLRVHGLNERSSPPSAETLNRLFNAPLKTGQERTSSDTELFNPFQGTVLLRGYPEVRFFCVPDRWQEEAEGTLESLRQMSRMKS